MFYDHLFIGQIFGISDGMALWLQTLTEVQINLDLRFADGLIKLKMIVIKK